MKRVVRNSTKYVLRIILEIQRTDEPGSNVAASDYVNDPSLKRSKKLSKDQVDELDYLLKNIHKLLTKFKFKIERFEQSHMSYSFYIEFIPADENGDLWPYSATIEFDVRDHERNDHSTGGWMNDQTFLKVFYVGNKTCFSTKGVLAEVKKICNQLRDGDYSSLEPMPESIHN